MDSGFALCTAVFCLFWLETKIMARQKLHGRSTWRLLKTSLAVGLMAAAGTPLLRASVYVTTVPPPLSLPDSLFVKAYWSTSLIFLLESALAELLGLRPLSRIAGTSTVLCKLRGRLANVTNLACVTFLGVSDCEQLGFWLVTAGSLEYFAMCGIDRFQKLSVVSSLTRHDYHRVQEVFHEGFYQQLSFVSAHPWLSLLKLVAKTPMTYRYMQLAALLPRPWPIGTVALWPIGTGALSSGAMCLMLGVLVFVHCDSLLRILCEALK